MQQDMQHTWLGVATHMARCEHEKRLHACRVSIANSTGEPRCFVQQYRSTISAGGGALPSSRNVRRYAHILRCFAVLLSAGYSRHTRLSLGLECCRLIGCHLLASKLIHAFMPGCSTSQRTLILVPQPEMDGDKTGACLMPLPLSISCSLHLRLCSPYYPYHWFGLKYLRHA